MKKGKDPGRSAFRYPLIGFANESLFCLGRLFYARESFLIRYGHCSKFRFVRRRPERRVTVREQLQFAPRFASRGSPAGFPEQCPGADRSDVEKAGCARRRQFAPGRH